MLEQVNNLKKNTAKQREAVEAEVGAVKEQIEAKGKELESYEKDVAALHARVNNMMVEAVGPSVAPKRADNAFQGLRAIKPSVGQDDDGLSTGTSNTRQRRRCPACSLFADSVGTC